jgi:DNA repair exonuclease SbcCD ATPase subunit
MTRELLDLPPTPSFSFADTNFIVDIELHADQLLAYINKLTSLADRACSTVLRQTEAAQSLEKNRLLEINHLREQLEQKTTKNHEQELALVRLEEESKTQIAVLESQLHLAKVRQQQAEKEAELKLLRMEKETLTNRLAQVEAASPRTRTLEAPHEAGRMQELVASKVERANRDESVKSKSDEAKKLEADFRDKIRELEQRLSEAQAESQSKDAQLSEKEGIIRATATKEAEMGNLIKRLSTECSALNTELQEKNRTPVARIDSKVQSFSDGKIWRRVIGRLQEEPQ